MKTLLVLLVLGVVACEPVTGIYSQKTTDGDTCVLPFTYNGITYNSCTFADYNRAWCYTNKAKSEFGSCTDDLNYKTAVDGSKCAFPFIYDGIKYDSCIETSIWGSWCSLTSNYDKDEEWGRCGDKDDVCS